MCVSVCTYVCVRARARVCVCVCVCVHVPMDMHMMSKGTTLHTPQTSALSIQPVQLVRLQHFSVELCRDHWLYSKAARDHQTEEEGPL